MNAQPGADLHHGLVEGVKRRSSAVLDQDALGSFLDSPIPEKRPKLIKEEPETFLPLSDRSKHLLVTVEVIQHAQKVLTREILPSGTAASSNAASPRQITLILSGYWARVPFAVGNVLRIMDPHFITDNTVFVSDTHGFLIVEPQSLVSSTTLVAARFCTRKAVLSTKFRKPTTNLALTLGSIVHELFQSVLRRRPRVVNEAWLLAEFRRDLLPSYTMDLLFLDLTREVFEGHLRPYLKTIVSWMRRHLPAPTGSQAPLVDGTVIQDIEDIEMNFWSDGIGVKGKVDVAVKAQNGTVIPLEIKTGKSAASTDHKAQVLMYCLMMAERFGGRIPTGVLLYLKDNIQVPVSGNQYEFMGLLQTRNNLAMFAAALGVSSFPEPKQDTRFCDKCDYAMHCTFLQKIAPPSETDPPISEQMTAFAASKTGHLTDEDIVYASSWLSWLFDEWSASKKSRASGDIFLTRPEEREARGSAMAGLKLTGSVEKLPNNRWKVTLEKSEEKEGDRVGSQGFEIGECVVVSTNSITAIGLAFVLERKNSKIIISMDKDPSGLLKAQNPVKFHLDKYDSSTTYLMMLNSVISVLEDTPQAASLRNRIIRLSPPQEAKISRDDVLKVAPIVKSSLSQTQGRAVIRALAAQDYALIQGFPGTGKTSTIVTIIRCLVATGKSVLLTSYTNSAVDNVLMRLKEHFTDDQLLRIGGSESTLRRPELEGMFLDGRIADFHDAKSNLHFDDIKMRLNQVPIVASTCLTIGSHAFFRWRRHFDVCIVDEAALCLQASLLSPLLLAEKFILVGDHLQLQPLVQCRSAKDEGMAVSLMERLEETAKAKGLLVPLTEQYRMNSEICSLSSELFYSGLLKCATDQVSDRVLELTGDALADLENIAPGKFLPADLELRLRSLKKSDSVVFVDTGSRAKGDHFQQTKNLGSKSNLGEIDVVEAICTTLMLYGVNEADIGVASPYRSQVNALLKRLPAGVETNTIDQYQGRDKDVVILSLVHTSDDNAQAGEAVDAAYKPTGFTLITERRLNVALTRAKKKLIIVGCVESLSEIDLMARLLNRVTNVCHL